MRIACTIAMCSLAAWFSCTDTARAVNLVSNGGFETGDFTAWTVQGTVSNLFQVSGFQSHSGTYEMYFADLEVDNDQISQITPTINGTQYLLEFWAYNQQTGDDGLRVYWEGNLVLDSTPLNAPDSQWTYFSLPLTATSNGSELRFFGFDVPLAIHLDDISLTPVPEPSTLVLAALGLAAVLVRRRAIPQN